MIFYIEKYQKRNTNGKRHSNPSADRNPFQQLPLHLLVRFIQFHFEMPFLDFIYLLFSLPKLPDRGLEICIICFQAVLIPISKDNVKFF